MSAPDHLSRIHALKKSVEETHGCAATHVDTVRVREVCAGQTVMHGDVEVFAILHPTSGRCYAWLSDEKPCAVLETAAVNSPEAAVRSVSAASSRQDAVASCAGF